MWPAVAFGTAVSHVRVWSCAATLASASVVVNRPWSYRHLPLHCTGVKLARMLGVGTDDFLEGEYEHPAAMQQQTGHLLQATAAHA